MVDNKPETGKIKKGTIPLLNGLIISRTGKLPISKNNKVTEGAKEPKEGSLLVEARQVLTTQSTSLLPQTPPRAVPNTIATTTAAVTTAATTTVTNAAAVTTAATPTVTNAAAVTTATAEADADADADSATDAAADANAATDADSNADINADMDPDPVPASVQCPSCGKLCSQLRTDPAGTGDYYLVDDTYAYCAHCYEPIPDLDEQ